MCLYRGISNVRQMINILNNWTAGGWRPSTINSFTDIKTKQIVDIMNNQVGTTAERYPRIVCIDDSILTERSVIEYTIYPNIANQFGLLGVITIEIEDRFVDTVFSKEGGVFCVSSAPVIITNVTLKEKNVCPYLTMAYDYYINYKEPPMGMTNNKKVYDVCRCTYKRKIIR